MTYANVIKEYKGQEGFLMEFMDSCFYKFTINKAHIPARSRYCIEEVGDDFVRLVRVNKGNYKRQKQIIVPIQCFALKING